MHISTCMFSTSDKTSIIHEENTLAAIKISTRTPKTNFVDWSWNVFRFVFRPVWLLWNTYISVWSCVHACACALFSLNNFRGWVVARQNSKNLNLSPLKFKCYTVAKLKPCRSGMDLEDKLVIRTGQTSNYKGLKKRSKSVLISKEEQFLSWYGAIEVRRIKEIIYQANTRTVIETRIHACNIISTRTQTMTLPRAILLWVE